VLNTCHSKNEYTWTGILLAYKGQHSGDQLGQVDGQTRIEPVL